MSNNVIQFNPQEVLPPHTRAHNAIINLWRWAAHIETDAKEISRLRVDDIRAAQIETIEFGFVSGVKSIEHLSDYVSNLAVALKRIAAEKRHQAMLAGKY